MNLNDKINLARKIAWLAGGFAFVLCVLLTINYIQSSSVKPAESKAIQALVERLKQNPQDELLVNEIRTFDLMARKAYFNNQWQLRTGGYLLLLSVIITVLAARFVLSHKERFGEMELLKKEPVLDTLLARKWLIYVGISLVGLAILSGVLSYNGLEVYKHAQQSEMPQDEINNEAAPQELVQDEVASADTIQTNMQSSEVISSSEEIPEEVQVTENSLDKEVKQEKTVEGQLAPTPSAKAADLKGNYPYFRGPEGNGIAYVKQAPTQWDGASGNNIAWKVKITKQGYSSPIVWKNKVFLTGADASSREVYCYDLSSGKLLWTARADNISGSPAQAPKVTADTGLAASTMATDGTHVFAIFATGDVLALDMDGKRIWAKNLGVPDNHYGHSSSLITYKSKLLIQYDTNRGARLIALDTATGEEKWTVARKSKISWASPLLVNTGNRMELILTTNPNVDSYDPETGKELWSVKCLSGEVGPSAAFGDGLVFAANEYATFAAIKPGDQAGIVWQNDEYLPEVASPLVINGMVVIATSFGVVAAYNTKDGTKLWEQEYGDGFYASPVYAAGNIYLMDMAGVCRVIKAEKGFQLVAESKLGEKSVCSPVFAGNKLLIRGLTNLYCIGK